MNDLINRQSAIDALRTCQTYLFDTHDKDKKISLEDAEYEIEQLPSTQPEVKKISYTDCANAMLMMWIDEVLTDGEYNRIMDKLNEHEKKKGKDNE